MAWSTRTMMSLALYTCFLWLLTSGLKTVQSLHDSHRGLAPTNVDFAFNMYRHLSTLDPHKNILISPVSVSMALAMMSLVAVGSKKNQFFQDVGFNLTEISKEEIYQSFEKLSHLLSKADSSLEMRMGNTMFLDQSLNMRDSFLTDIEHYHESEALTTDFKDGADAREHINRHVETKTQGEITHVFSDQDSPAPLTLVNYNVLKGMWELPISPENTRDEDFHVSENSTVRVPMMFQSGVIGYLHDSEIPCQLVQMQYLKNGTTFFILPDEGQMDAVTAALHRDTVERWDKLLTKRLVNLYIPRVYMSGTYNLEDVLEGMGITGLFTNQTDFLDISQDPPQKASKIVHKVMLQLDEKDEPPVTTTEAPPQTTSEPLTLTFNKPFIIMMFDSFTWSSLLLGKIMNPA
ncbi:corticosteroid-binding globulin precursor [Mesocricetus auratus]|uniref:Corticosteroid-binding globulin n=2 Tax=Mesocricetus auratus TaxID=10036 RepID=CBG_MESAU|nr:corticosteroid-binding globulin precursor [Mesocricetus auratus]Q60543.1 RecName: Full=Corticosteroid-binding globulin; Short=CBG; AltName: Full=Serpin A6; AltName: Full=Transcortin; Flags: Precursor [Mesocricetus auratus]AAA37065.1 corticosteroid-binding protein [Mesocricetus auratus]